ncbi:MAG: N-6 DNA methylase [Candidatus Marinimicrobia bacterium]|nr:N-6 DNA methylase [Candidatus Neomarinimicrobiota bacterium]MBT7084260.1 N-6 DNA methylase [Candidatus Neomarinimicrobiota bacterium]
MLDQETKRRIDSCRDMLVGKIPDPKSQVEQITIALIYKFMDDMDKESVEMGGKASFFTGDYAKYSWTAIFDPRIGGHELTKLYGEAIEKMNQNPNIPQLFRDIFKNAYLPYRDPETLKLFLKEINNFDYSHSEKLGDAFEYLLSFMGTQGDAGQFRTPRHIIDFIAEAVNPQKHETILDPACGTAGFLISAYKHILKANDNGKKLTPTERKRMLSNFTGYDISPDMVRLSLVNLYLHGFQDPKILEYDTLTSEERWNESVDVILANPPFMTPKGGIRPHKRFSIQAKRSEVLFVDYIAEHLNPNGRAGIIVPEGIIFQSSNAYKNLRKMLIEDYLWAVVSLPAGVFQPYSGVKTSILFLDKTKAKQNDSILFVKVENDGFDLGAQRRPVDKNDLPEALRILGMENMESIDYVDGALTQSMQSKNKPIAHWVKKSKIEESGDWNLSGERYKESIIVNTDYEMVNFDEIISTVIPPKKIKKNDYLDYGKYPIIDQSQDEIAGWTDDKNALIIPEKPFVIFGDHTCAVKIITQPFAQGADGIKILRTNEELKPEFLFNYLKTNPLESDGYKRHYSKLKRIQIPLPPLSVQEEIVAEIDCYQKIIDGARQVVDNYKPTIKIDPDWEMVKLGEVCEVNEKTENPNEVYGENEFIYIDITSVENGTGVVSFDNFVVGDEAPSRARRKVKNRDVLLSTVRPNLKAFGYLKNVPENAIASTGFAVLTAKEKVIPQFVFYLLFGDALQSQMISRMGRGSYPSINQKDVNELQIPLPPLTVQQEIVTQIEAEQEMVNGNKKLIEIYEQKIKDKIGEVWGEE